MFEISLTPQYPLVAPTLHSTQVPHWSIRSRASSISWLCLHPQEPKYPEGHLASRGVRTSPHRRKRQRWCLLAHEGGVLSWNSTCTIQGRRLPSLSWPPGCPPWGRRSHGQEGYLHCVRRFPSLQSHIERDLGRHQAASDQAADRNVEHHVRGSVTRHLPPAYTIWLSGRGQLYHHGFWDIETRPRWLPVRTTSPCVVRAGRWALRS